MKVLLDENLDHRLRKCLGDHDIVTVSYMGWMGLKNGELLRMAEENGIQVFVTSDRTLSYEQNLAGRQLAVIVLSSIELPILRNIYRQSPLRLAVHCPVRFKASIAARSAAMNRSSFG